MRGLVELCFCNVPGRVPLLKCRCYWQWLLPYQGFAHAAARCACCAAAAGKACWMWWCTIFRSSEGQSQQLLQPRRHRHHHQLLEQLRRPQPGALQAEGQPAQPVAGRAAKPAPRPSCGCHQQCNSRWCWWVIWRG
jgi:hypothetical protein